MELRFILGPYGNAFMTELMGALAAATEAEGVAAEVCESDAGWRDDVVDVVVPHELYLGREVGTWPSRRQRQRTIGLVTEHPGTSWFEVATLAVADLGAGFALNQAAVAECRARGLRTDHLQLGYTPNWDRWGGGPVERPTEITYLGVAEGRRNQVLAGFSPTLWRRRCALLIPPMGRGNVEHPDFLVGDAKWRHLASSQVLINLHRGGVFDTEWPRVIEAMSNGCVVVSEHCSDATPLVPGEHYLSASAADVADLANAILDDPDELDRVRRSAYQFVRHEMPMAHAARALVDRATALVSRRWPPARAFLPPVSHDTLLDASGGRARPADDAATNGHDRAMLKSVAIGLREVQRRQRRLELRLDGETEPDGVREVRHRSDAAAPRVSVIMPLFNHEREVLDALRSTEESEFRDFEVVIVDDGSDDGSVAAATQWLDSRPAIRGGVYAALLNHGPSWARNRAIERARGEFLFLLDSDNAIYPPTLGRLVEALDQDPEAALAYPIVALHTPEGPLSLMSHMAWRPEIFRTGQNPVDTMAMVRRAIVQDLGGFAEDPRLMGLEDYDLWCRVAERGLRGVSVPELLGWYRRTPHSMVALADIDRSEAMMLLAGRSPGVFGNAAT
ncbi:MAG: hypothetical protein QOK05_3001 [Chloroflexota bacterium]|nr:hypothetical protein [Chloroflexota bacterium]